MWIPSSATPPGRRWLTRYDDNQLIDLLYGVGEITMHADFANTLRTEIEPPTR